MFRIVRYFVILGMLGLFAQFTQSAVAQNRYVELQVISAANGELGSQQRVMQMLSEVGADRVSSRTARNRVRPSIDESESDGLTNVRIVGVLDGSKLKLPGQTFSINNAAGIRDFIQKLRDDGSTITLADKKGFGLTSEQLAAVHEDLSTEVGVTTKGQPSNAIVERMTAGLQKEVTFSRQALAALDTTPVLEEYQGLSTGTALAGILRPLGLVLVPQREQGQALQFQIATSGEAEEHWPIGWPVEAAPVEVAPELFEKLEDVAIHNFALKDALDAIEGRVGVTFLYDQNSMARSGVDMSQLQVTLVRKKMLYFTVVRKLITQNKPSLSLEVRKDENDKPFLWIAPSQ